MYSKKLFIQQGLIFILFIITISFILFEGNSYHAFLVYYLFVFLIFPPKFILSPLFVVYAFYGAWYVIAPTFASGYPVTTLMLPEYQESYLYLTISFTFLVLTASFFNIKNNSFDLLNRIEVPLSHSASNYYFKIVILYIVSSLMIVLIVQYSGGISKWIQDPGDAFLNRSGTGLFVIVSHFTTIMLALFTGYLSYMRRNKSLLIVFLLWLIVTSPVHGSKFQLVVFLSCAFLPWLFRMRVFSKMGIVVAILSVLLFTYGMILRTEGVVDWQRILSYLNYFSSLHNLAISVRDFNPSFMETWFLPFNKFLTPFGLIDNKMYYDMNHMLTDFYYPDAWEIRATEQWPVETDLYLNFYFYFGIPFLMLYMAVINYVYTKALNTNRYGYLFLSCMLTLYIISHLRGSLYNHVDFYLYPLIGLCFFIIRKERYGK